MTPALEALQAVADVPWAAEAPEGSATSQALCMDFIFKDPVAFRDYFVPKVSRQRYWQRYTFIPVTLAAAKSNALLKAGRGTGKCVDGDTLVMDPETGQLRAIRDAVQMPLKTIATMTPNGIEVVGITAAWASGQQACLELALKSGRTLRLTPSHPLLTAEGWVPAGRLRVGETVATPSILPGPQVPRELPWPDVDLLAILLAEGGLTTSSVVYTSADPEIVRIATEAADELGVVSRTWVGTKNITHLLNRSTRLGPNPVRLMLSSYGIERQGSKEKVIPEALFCCSAEQLSRFLSIFWMCDGYVVKHEIGIALASERMVRQIQHLLLRFGVQSKVTYKPTRVSGKEPWHDSWRLAVYAASIEAFCHAFTLWGRKAERLQSLREYRRNPNAGEYPTVSKEFAQSLKSIGPGSGRVTKSRAYFSLPIFRAWATQHGVQDRYPALMNNSLWWDPIVSINPVGLRDTYDLEVFATRCFVAGDVVVHNSMAGLEPDIVQGMIARPGEETILTAMRKAHVVDRMEPILDYFELIPLLKLFLRQYKRQPHYTIELKNGHIGYGISIGDDPEAKMAQGKHATRIRVEEGHQYPLRAWLKLQGATDPRGCIFWLVGVPDGRMDTPYRNADSRYRTFEGRRFKISRRSDPLWNQRTKADRADQYGGEDSELFRGEVDAEWGSPSWAAWDLEALVRCFSQALPKVLFEISGREYKTQGYTPAMALAEVYPPDRPGRRRLAADIGYSEPTEIGIFEEMEPGLWSLIFRMELQKRMEDDDQADIFDLLGQRFEVEQIAMDTSEGMGRAIANNLEQRPEWLREGGGTRIIRVTFNEKAISGWVINKETGEPEPVHDTFRDIGTQSLRRLISRRQVALPIDEDIYTAFNKESETRGLDGKVRIVTPQDVHITDMFRVFGVMVYVDAPPAPPRTKSAAFCMPELGVSPWAMEV